MLTNEPIHIAEIGVNHDGDIKLALELISAAAGSGANYVKFQHFAAKSLVNQNTPTARYQKLRTGQRRQLDLLKTLELSVRNIEDLICRASKENIDIMFSPFGRIELDQLLSMGVKNFKIASGEAFDHQLVEKIASQTEGLLVTSTGMSSMNELNRNVSIARMNYQGPQFAILHCVSNYPTETRHSGLGTIEDLRRHYPEDLIGFSDHTLGSSAACAALALGACIFEKHITLDRRRKGPDHFTSMEIADYCNHIVLLSHLFESLRSVRPSTEMFHFEKEIAKAARKAVYCAKDIQKGELFTEQNLVIQRPWDGKCASSFLDLLGTRAFKSYISGEKV